MRWIRILPLLFRVLLNALKLMLTKQLWRIMLRCQGGHEVLDAQQFFGAQTARDANEVLKVCPEISCVLFFSFCG